MSAEAAPNPEVLYAGDVITFAHLSEMTAFEDLIAPLVEPDNNTAVWSMRPPLKDSLKPDKFFGNLLQPALTIMASPYDRLLDARSRGQKFPKGASNFARNGSITDELIARCLGFVFTAETNSLAIGSKPAQIQAELWYYPTPPVIKAVGRKTRTLASGEVTEYTVTKDYVVPRQETDPAIRRVTTLPKRETKNFIVPDESARKVGLSALQQAIALTIISTERS